MIAVDEEKVECPRCKSKDIRKNGMILKSGGERVQRYQCRDCGYSFTLNKKKRGKRP